MPYLLNAGYFLVLLVLSPWLLYKALTTGKYRRGMWSKFTGRTGLAAAPREPGLGDHSPLTTHHSPLAAHSSLITHHSSLRTVWFHGVSVGEIHLLRPLLAEFRRRHPERRCVISTTTDTGYDEARKRFSDLQVIFWPLDFSWAVERALREVKPDLVVLAECELWPNFLLAARRQGVPVAVINGRMSPRSFRHWSWLGGRRPGSTSEAEPRERAFPGRAWERGQFAPFSFFLFPFSLIDLWCVQTEEYAECFRGLGVPAERVRVTGSIKYDGVESDRDNPRTRQLRELLGIGADELVWIAGSTQDPEERIVLDIYRRAREQHPNLRLCLVPRQKERFDEVATLLQRSGLPFVRRSEVKEPNEPGFQGAGLGNDLSSCHPVILSSCHPIVLVDTIGELGALWGLADVAYVGGSMDGRRGGQNMIEPAAYGSAVLFGPHVWNFRDVVSRLLGAGAAVQVHDAGALKSAVLRLLGDPAERARLGSAARQLVASQQGATVRTVDLIDALLDQRRALGAAA